MSSEPICFHEFFKLPEDLVHSAHQVTSFAGHFIDVNQPKAFQWQKFLDGINSYKGDELAMDKFESTTINQQTAAVSTMVDKIVDYLRAVFGVRLSEDVISELSKNIEKTFTDLNTSETHGWANYSTSGSSRNPWQYRLHIAFPNPNLPNFFYSVLTTINVKADIREESSWWGMKTSTQNNFSAAIDAMELIVQKGFENPINSTA